MKYIELRVQFENDLFDEKYEMLLVELVMQGFEGFVESGNSLIGYIQANQFNKKNVKKAKENGFKRISQKERNGWIMDRFIKSPNG